MIPFYVVCVLWLATFGAWTLSERRHASERMELLKLFKAQSLTDFTVQTKETPKQQTNYLQTSITRAYANLRGEDDG